MQKGRIYDIKSANSYFFELFAQEDVVHERWKIEMKKLKDEFRVAGFYRYFYYKVCISPFFGNL
jgi:hypothetical protein